MIVDQVAECEYFFPMKEYPLGAVARWVPRRSVLPWVALELYRKGARMIEQQVFCVASMITRKQSITLSGEDLIVGPSCPKSPRVREQQDRVRVTPPP